MRLGTRWLSKDTECTAGLVQLGMEFFPAGAFLGSKRSQNKTSEAPLYSMLWKAASRWFLPAGSQGWVETFSSLAFCHCYWRFLWQDWETPVPHLCCLEIGRPVLCSLQRLASPGFNSQGFQTCIHGPTAIPFRLGWCSSLGAGLSPSDLVLPLTPQQPKQRYRCCSLHLCLHACFVNKTVYTDSFSFHVYVLIYSICVFLLAGLLHPV